MSDDKTEEQEDQAEGKQSNFVTPRENQSEEPIGADEGRRDIPTEDEAATGELDPEGEEADQSSLGGSITGQDVRL